MTQPQPGDRIKFTKNFQEGDGEGILLSIESGFFQVVETNDATGVSNRWTLHVTHGNPRLISPAADATPTAVAPKGRNGKHTAVEDAAPGAVPDVTDLPDVTNPAV